MKITRRYTRAGEDPFGTISFESRSSRIANPDGTVVFEAPSVQVPEAWSQVAEKVVQKVMLKLKGPPGRTM